jgi:uncharacterized protein with PIN domain
MVEHAGKTWGKAEKHRRDLRIHGDCFSLARVYQM